MKIINGLCLFWTGTFSNWKHASFKDPVSGLVFENSEQCFMYYKARFFHDEKIMEQIARTPLPRENKELGRQIKNFNHSAWDMVCRGYMTYANYLKYAQNEDMKAELLSTIGLHMVEASPVDCVWGIGLAEDNPDAANPLKWRGTNYLGDCLDDVRLRLST